MTNPRPNPYIGPRSFQTGEQLYGRDREINELFDLLIAERIVLLHSPSGAGKSSLVYAGLVPLIGENSFRVLPVIRVNLERPVELLKGDDSGDLRVAFNRYVFSTLLSLEEGFPIEERTALPHLARATLEGYVSLLRKKLASGTKDGSVELADERAPEPSTLIIFDQFEEILTVDPNDREIKQAFFQQLGSLLRDRDIWALFIIREDYLAGLDPYVRPIPTRLSNTYRLDLLDAAAAQQAIEEPTRLVGVSFASSASQKLVDDLRRVQVQQPDGSMLEQFGPYVEPVQLQVVCYRLWDNLEADDLEITESDLAMVGDVNQSLAEFYCDRIQIVAEQAKVQERDIREWFDRKLITENSIRGQVLMQPEASSGLDNRAISKLVSAHLVRAEKRRNATWFELAHDRLIRPVKQNNAAWFQANLSLLQRQAGLWEDSKRSDSLLLRAEALQESQTWAEAHPEKLTASEKDFLASSLQAEARAGEMQRLEVERQRAEEKARGAALLRRLLAVTAIAAIAALIFGIVAAYQGTLANRQTVLASNNAGTAQAASTLAAGNQIKAELNATQANLERDRADEQRILAEYARATADYAYATAEVDRKLAQYQEATARVAKDQEAQQRSLADANASLALSRQLAAQAQNYLTTNPSLAYLLAIEALHTSNTYESLNILLTSLQQNLGQNLQPYGLPPGKQDTYIYTVALHPNKPYLAWGDKQGNVVVWNYEKGEPLWSHRGNRDPVGHLDSVSAVTFSPDGNTLATGSPDKTVILWDVESGQGRSFDMEGLVVYGLDYSPKGDQLAVAREFRVVIYDTATMKVREVSNRMTHNELGIYTISWDPNGKWIASSGEDGHVKVWDAVTGVKTQDFNIGGKVYGVSWSQDGKYLAAGNTNHDVVLWQTGQWKELGRMVHDVTPENRTNTAVLDVAFIGDGLLASAGNDNRIVLWDMITLSPRQILPLGPGQLRSLDSLTAKGLNLLASGGTDNMVRIFEVKSLLPLSENQAAPGGRIDGLWIGAGEKLVSAGITPTGMSVRDGQDQSSLRGKYSAIAFSPDGEKLALGGEDGTIQVVERGSGEVAIPPIQVTDQPISSLAFSPNGNQIASSHCISISGEQGDPPTCNSSEIHFWDVATGQAIGDAIPIEGEFIPALVYHPTEDWLATAIGDTVQIIDLQSRQPIRLPWVGHADLITSLAFSPDGKMLVSADQGQKIILWSTQNGQSIGKPLSAGQVVHSLAFNPSGEYFYTGGEKGIIDRWEASEDQWVARLCQLAGRNLSAEEIRQFLPEQQTDHITCP